MTHAITKEVVKGNVLGATTCMDPAIGQEQVAAYIVGDMTEATRRDFVAHMGECRRCLEQVVLWHMIEELSGAGEQSPQGGVLLKLDL